MDKGMNERDQWNFRIQVPFIFEMSIFLIFRFAEWKNTVNEDIQLRVFWGANFIALFFIIYYIQLFLSVKKEYNNIDGNIMPLIKILFFAGLGFLSYIIGYYVHY